LRNVLLVVTLPTVGLSLASCKTKEAPKAAAPVQTGELGQVVARIDDTVITVGDVQERINKQAPFVRARFSAPEKKKEFVDNLIRIEVMAKEAERRGYDKDPEVVRVMKQQMISKFLQKDFESKLKVEDVADADVEKYYKDHPEEFNRPDEVRVSEILVKDKAKADKVAREANAASRSDPKAFRDLVTKYSEDEDSKSRGGDLTSFDRDSKTVPRPIVDAAFALKEVGDISPPIKLEQGLAIIKLTGKRPGFSRPLAEVKRTIQQRLFKDLRTKSMEAFVADLRKKYAVTIDEGNLAKIAIDTGMSQPAGAPPGPGGMPPGMNIPGMPGVPGHGPMPPAPAAVAHPGSP
jgi:peptidyl-prolyl cis-trans isomerase C